MCPWPFGGSRRASQPAISQPIPFSFTSSDPELDRVSVHVYGLDGGGATPFDLVNANGLRAPAGGRQVPPGQIEAVLDRTRAYGLEHLHFTWDSVLPEIASYGSPRGYCFKDSNPYIQHWGAEVIKRGFDADASPIFVSTSRYEEAASFFGPMDRTWGVDSYPVVLGLRDYPITGVTGLTQVSRHAIESSHIQTVFAPVERLGDTRSALFAKPDIAVEAWPKAARGNLARVGIGRVRSYENLDAKLGTLV